MRTPVQTDCLCVLVTMAFCLVGLTPSRAVDGVIISSGSVTADDIRGPLNESHVALATNLPAGKWIWGAGWNWGEPFVPAAWDPPPRDMINLAEEKTALGVSLRSNGSYTKPAHFRIAADLAISGDAGGGLGFWTYVPARDDEESPLTHFTGLNLMLNGDLQIYEDGVAIGTPVHAAENLQGGFNRLSYDVDTKTGAISNVTLNGKPVAGLTSHAFSDSATSYAGVLTQSGRGVRMSMNNFEVLSLEIAPAASGKPGKNSRTK